MCGLATTEVQSSLVIFPHRKMLPSEMPFNISENYSNDFEFIIIRSLMRQFSGESFIMRNKCLEGDYKRWGENNDAF